MAVTVIITQAISQVWLKAPELNFILARTVAKNVIKLVDKSIVIVTAGDTFTWICPRQKSKYSGTFTFPVAEAVLPIQLLV